MADDLTKDNYTWTEELYLLFCWMALLMFFFAHAPFMIDKSFYVPCIGAFITSFFLPYKWDKIDTIVMGIICLGGLSDLANFVFPTSVESPVVRQAIGILCFNNMRKYNLSRIVKIIALSSPVLIASLYFLTHPFTGIVYRYAGFSGDPNYLAISLNLLLAIDIIYLYIYKPSGFMRLIIIITIIAIVPLFLAGKSRAGLVSVILLSLFILMYTYRRNKVVGIGIIVTLFLLSGTIYGIFSKSIDAVAERFDTLEQAQGGARVMQFSAVHDVYRDYPYLILYGVGFDKNPRDYPQFSAKSKFMIHNTFLNILFQQGVITLIAYGYLLLCVYKAIGKEDIRLIYLGLFLSLLINISSVQSTTYLTFWWTIFFILGYNQTVFYDNDDEMGGNKNELLAIK